jgi:hypothetical protein
VSGRAGRACGLLVVVAALAMPPACGANPLDIPAVVPAKFRSLVRARLDAPKPHRHSWVSRFELETRNGYSLAVTGVEDTVVVEVTRKGDTSVPGGPRGLTSAVTAYVARGTVTPGQIKASFGEFGRIAVRFHPSGRVVKSDPRRRCRGPDHYTSRPGVYTGSIRLTGEHHYFAVRAHRAKGRIRRPLGLNCASRATRPAGRDAARAEASDEIDLSFNVLQAGWREAVDATEFLALQIGGKTLYLAITEESKGTVAEIRFAVAIGPSRTFVRNEALTSARLRPPRPFAGTGVYSAAPDGTRTWGGRLSVSVPGWPRLPLAGPGFKVFLDAEI